jgi:hypothetical protein
MRNVLIFALWAGLALPASAAVAFVQAVSAAGVCTNPCSVNITATSGHALYVGISWPDATHTVSITDSGGTNTYTQIGTDTNSFGTSYAFYTKNITGGALTIRAAIGASVSRAMVVMEFSGVDTTTALGGTATGHNWASDGNAIVSGSLSVVASAGDAVIANAGNYWPPTWTVGATNPSGFTIPTGATSAVGPLDGDGHGTAGYAILSGSYSGAASLKGSATQTYGSIVVGVFKAASAPAASPARRRIVADDWLRWAFGLLWRA